MKSSRLAAALLAAMLIAPLAACSSSGGSAAPQPESPSSDFAPQSGSSAGGDADAGAQLGQKSPAERSVIRSGDIILQVDDPADSSERISGIAEDLGGFVESQSIDRGDEGAAGAYLQLRVPADRLDEALHKLAEVGSVISQSSSSSDVTTEHVDLQARVKAL